MHRHPLAAALAAVTLAAASSGASADATAEAIRRLEATLEKQGAQLESQRTEIEAQRREIERLRRQLDARAVPTEDLRQPVAAAPAPAAKPTPPAPATLSLENGRPVFAAADGRSTLALRGIMQLDAAWYDQDEAGTLATDFRRGSVGAGSRETTAAGDLSSGTNFRRARLGVEGRFAGDFGYKFVGEFGGSGVENPTRINDAWLSYAGFAPLTLQLGAFAPPANMDDSTSVEDLPFIERSSPSEIARAMAGGDGRVGLGLRGNGARWMGALTLTGGVAGEAETFDEQRALVGRAGVLALTAPDYNLHLGVSGTWVFRPADQGAGAADRYALRLRDRPEIRVDGTRLIDTGPLDADGARVTGLEFGANWRNLYLQAEGFDYRIERRARALDEAAFDGFYVQGSWVITGETRRYNPASGAFQGPKPAAPFAPGGSPGAWELAWRYSRMDLDHDAGQQGLPAAAWAVRGGEQEVTTLGLNWTLNPNLKLVFDWMHVDVERLNPATASGAPFGPAPATPPAGVEIGQELDVYSLRSQYAF